MTKKKESKKGKWVTVQDCVVTYDSTVYAFKKDVEIKNDKVLEILKQQGLAELKEKGED